MLIICTVDTGFVTPILPLLLTVPEKGVPDIVNRFLPPFVCTKIFPSKYNSIQGSFSHVRLQDSILIRVPQVPYLTSSHIHSVFPSLSHYSTFQCLYPFPSTFSTSHNKVMITFRKTFKIRPMSVID